MTQELYFNGERVDLSPNEEVTLQYRSNIFGDIDKITSSNSLTIRLPKTPNNNRIMNFSDVPFMQGIARQWYNASYIRNGVPLVNGRAALLSASREYYEICLVWGLFDKLEQFLKTEKTLRDLPLNFPVQLKHYSLDVFSDTKVPYGLLYYYNGGQRYAFPVVIISIIFSRILLGISNAAGSTIGTSKVDIRQLENYYLNFNDNLVDELVQANNEPTFVIKDWIPAIKVMDFFKGICHFMGWYIEIQQNGLELVDFEYATDKSNAVNWSDKLASVADVPETIEFQYGDYAQHNWMRYKPDDSIAYPTNADGSVDVEDTTIDVDKTLFTLPFAASYKDEIIQYRTVLNDDGAPEIEFIKTEPRIMKIITENVTKPYLSFTDDMKFSSIIANRYSKYSEMMSKPTVINVRLKLTEFDLVSLDFTRPVYIAQYGSYFSIIEIQSSGYICNAKLIKLN